MALECLGTVAAAGIPDLDCVIVQRWGDHARVGREGARGKRIRIASMYLKAAAATSIPDLDRLIDIVRCRCDPEVGFIIGMSTGPPYTRTYL